MSHTGRMERERREEERKKKEYEFLCKKGLGDTYWAKRCLPKKDKWGAKVK